MENIVLIIGIICLVLFLILTINTINFIKKNENVEIDKIRKKLNVRISLSIVFMIATSVLSIIYIILKNV